MEEKHNSGVFAYQKTANNQIIKTNSAGVWLVVFLHYTIKLRVSAKDVVVEKAQQYRKLLSVEGNVLPHPRADLNSNCVGEARGMCMWAP